MSARFIVADVFDGLATLEDGSVDLVVTSPPFLALRSYLPADHEHKGEEIGSEATPAEFLDVMLRFTAELRRVVAPHGSICIELGDTYAGGSSVGTDWKDGNDRYPNGRGADRLEDWGDMSDKSGPGWPLQKSKTLIPELFRIALAYGINPLTGQPSPAGRWRVRNVVTWARPNPPVGQLGDKWRPATSDVVVACVSGRRYWDDLATRKINQPHRFHEPAGGRPHMPEGLGNQSAGTSGGSNHHSGAPLLDYWEIPLLEGDEERRYGPEETAKPENPRNKVLADGTRYRRGLRGRIGTDGEDNPSAAGDNPAGAPLLDYWEIPPGGYTGSHYAVFPPELVVPLVKAMCPERVCRTCGEPSRRIVEANRIADDGRIIQEDVMASRDHGINQKAVAIKDWSHTERSDLGWTDCGHDNWRPGLVLDPFAGSGTTLLVATGHGHDAVGIDLDRRNADLALERVGPFLLEVEG